MYISVSIGHYARIYHKRYIIIISDCCLADSYDNDAESLYMIVNISDFSVITAFLHRTCQHWCIESFIKSLFEGICQSIIRVTALINNTGSLLATSKCYSRIQIKNRTYTP